jgi:hypothetical protein
MTPGASSVFSHQSAWLFMAARHQERGGSGLGEPTSPNHSRISESVAPLFESLGRNRGDWPETSNFGADSSAAESSLGVRGLSRKECSLQHKNIRVRNTRSRFIFCSYAGDGANLTCRARHLSRNQERCRETPAFVSDRSNQNRDYHR